MNHIHHIIPRHAGGTDSPDNLIELTVEEHAEAHRLLWEANGDLRDKLAWLMLAGKTDEAEDARIELAKCGFKEFLFDKERRNKWKERISQSLRGHKQSEHTRQQRSESLKRAYAEGRKEKTKFTHEFYSALGRASREPAAEARRNSERWHEAVRSPESREKKRLSSPKRKPIIIDNVEYQSIRHAAKMLGIPYSRLRKMIQ